MLMRIKLILEYDGSRYNGWQRQEDGVPSVQQAVEDALFGFCGQKVTVHAAGRTDAGVHAWGQVVHVDVDLDPKYEDGFLVVKAINAHLRASDAAIAAVHAARVADDFHARFSATEKLYMYRIVNRPAPLAIEAARAWVVHPPLDEGAMRAAAAHLIGHHDFTSFRDSECQAKSPIKTLDELRIDSAPYDESGGVEIKIYARARSFLHHQVRNMTGTLVQVGLGRFDASDIPRMLAAKDRSAAGVTAPPHGLYLVQVRYD